MAMMKKYIGSDFPALLGLLHAFLLSKYDAAEEELAGRGAGATQALNDTFSAR